MRAARDLRSVFSGFRKRVTRAGRPAANDSGMVVDGDLLQKLDRLSLSLGRDLIHGLMGEHLAVRRTSGIEFADYRQYSAGDDLRRVDWNAYARLGTLHVRQSQAEHDTLLYLLVDGSPSMEFGQPSKFLLARRLAAALGYIALAHLDGVVMTTPGAVEDARKPSGASLQSSSLNTIFRGRAEAGSLFRTLQALKTQSVAQFDDLMVGWTARHGQGRIAVVISDLLLDGYRDGVLQLLSSGFQVTVLHVLSSEELSPPDMGDLELLDSETGALMDVYLGKEGLDEYLRQLRAWLADSEEWVRSHGANYLMVHSEWDVERIMLDMLRRRGVTA
ncbi:MAG: DUF58 domain-containing protein [Chloroflexota bacterium]